MAETGGARGLVSSTQIIDRAEDLWVCPTCRGSLERDRERWHCPSCAAFFGSRFGIPRFAGSDGFYEGRFQTTKPLGVRGGWRGAFERRFGEFRIQRFLDRWVTEGTTVLDLGCGGGRRFLARRARRTIGIDLSMRSLEIARDVYDRVAAADLHRLPLPDGSVDVVVSVDVLEHVPLASKDAVIAEMTRVLRPGGRMVHYFDCDSEKWLHRWAKQFPDLYETVHVQQHGHVGLEPIRDAWARFHRFGLEPLCEVGHNRSNLLYPETADWMLSEEYANRAIWAKLYRGWARFLLAHPILRRLHRIATILYYDAIEPWLPLEHSFSSGVCYEKPLSAWAVKRAGGEPRAVAAAPRTSTRPPTP